MVLTTWYHYTSKRTIRLSTIFGAVDFDKNWSIMTDVISGSGGGSGQGAAGHGARGGGPMKPSFLELSSEPPVK